MSVYRLWLVPRTQSHRQQPINFTDFVPDSRHDSIQSLVAKLNKKIEHRQLKGNNTHARPFNGRDYPGEPVPER